MEQTLVLTGRAVDAAVSRDILKRAWWGVVAVFLVHGLVVSTWVSRIAGVKTSLRLGDGALGLALLGSAIGSMVAIPLTGWAITRYGSKRAVLATAAGFCFSLLLLAIAPNFLALFAALFVYGAMAGASDVSINAQAVGVEKLLGNPTMSRFHAMFSLGGIIGAALGGLLAARGVSPGAHFIAAALAILLLIIATVPLTLDVTERAAERGRVSLRRPPRALLILSAIGFCIFLSEGAIADWTAVYITQVLNAGEGTAAAGYAVFSVTMTAFRLGGDAITVWLGRAWTIRAGSLLAACGLTIVVLASSPGWALAGFAAAGAGFSSIIPVVFAAGGRISTMSEAAGVATVSGIGYMGFLVGPPLIGFVSELTNLRAGLFTLVVLSALAALLVWPLQRSTTPEDNPLR